MTNKTNVKGSERLGLSNLSEAEFSAYINTKDYFTFNYQIYNKLRIIEVNPIREISLTGFVNQIKFFLNQIVIQNSVLGGIKLKNSLGVVMAEYDPSDLIFDGIYYTLNMAPFTPALGSYKIEIPSGLFSSTFETTSFYSWNFKIVSSDYSDLDYSTDYLI